MANAKQKLVIIKAKHKDRKKRPIAIKKSSGTTITHFDKYGYVTITKIDYKGNKTVTRMKRSDYNSRERAV